MRSSSSSAFPTSKRNTTAIVTSSFPAVGDWLVPAADFGRERCPPPAGPTCRARTRAHGVALSRIGSTTAHARLDGVLAREQRRVALHRIAEQALVGAPSRRRWWCDDASSIGLGEHLSPGRLTRAPMRDRSRPGSAGSARSCAVARRRRWTSGRALQLTMHFGRRHRQALARRGCRTARLPSATCRCATARRRRSRPANRARRPSPCGSRGTGRAPVRRG